MFIPKRAPKFGFNALLSVCKSARIETCIEFPIMRGLKIKGNKNLLCMPIL